MGSGGLQSQESQEEAYTSAAPMNVDQPQRIAEGPVRDDMEQEDNAMREDMGVGMLQELNLSLLCLPRPRRTTLGGSPSRMLFGPANHGELEQWIGDMLNNPNARREKPREIERGSTN